MAFEPLREPPPGFVETETRVEGMGFPAPISRRQEDQATPAVTRLGLHRFHESLADAAPTMRLIDDDGAQLRCRLVVFD
ncbi:MAG: hypothetical protein M3322_09770 [Actinomycetota bacterium]|nr:hypothetical protein [Actinomycetota bacterium]